MRLLLMIIMVTVSCGVFAQQEQRQPKRMDEVSTVPASEKKGSGQTRNKQPGSFDQVVPSVTVNNPADKVKWDKLPQRRLKPVAKPVDYNEIVK